LGKQNKQTNNSVMVLPTKGGRKGFILKAGILVAIVIMVTCTFVRLPTAKLSSIAAQMSSGKQTPLPPVCHIHFMTKFFGQDGTEFFARQPGDETCSGQFQIQISTKDDDIFPSTADVYLAHFRDDIPVHLLQNIDHRGHKRSNSTSSPIRVLYGVENAAFSPKLKDAALLQKFDYMANSNIETASIPLFSLRMPPSNGHVVPSFQERPHFAMLAWSHCEPVRTEYAKRMLDYASSNHGVKVASMGKCLNNDSTAMDDLQKKGICPDYQQDTWEPRQLGSKCRGTSFPDMAARSYKFSLVFQNADCDYWVDLRLQTAWASGSIVVFMGTKKSLLQTFIPPALMDAIMFAEDYASPEDLVDAMVAMDEAEFTRRLAWTTQGYDPSLWYQAMHGTEHVQCQLCRLRFDGALQDGHVPPPAARSKAMQPDLCSLRKRSDWLYD
jgi:hypothetical protein